MKWFRDDVEVDTAAAPLAAGVRGVLHVGPLSRADVRATLTCRASNHLRAHPIETTLTLDMNCELTESLHLFKEPGYFYAGCVKSRDLTNFIFNF